MPRSLSALLLAPVLALACRAAPAALPAGRGLVTVDRGPPAGAVLAQQPAWKVGDRFVYRKGGLSRLAFRVESTTAGVHRLVDEQGDMALLVGEDLSEHGQEKPGDPSLTVAYDPADYALTWPLWVGKRWSSSFVSRGRGRADIPLLATYECDASEDVTVPAGRFRCLRIWRRARLAAEGNWIDRISIAWYSPDLGVVVRRLSDSILTELEEIDRQ
jgi:hypothetical protein